MQPKIGDDEITDTLNIMLRQWITGQINSHRDKVLHSTFGDDKTIDEEKNTETAHISLHIEHYLSKLIQSPRKGVCNSKWTTC